MKNLLFIGQFPPPLHGVSVINNFLCRELEGSYNLTRYDYRFVNDLKSINESSNIKKTLFFIKHLFRISRVLFSSKKIEYIYFTPNVRGASFYRDLILIQLFRLTKSKVFLHLHGLGIDAKPKRIMSHLYRAMFHGNNVIHVSEKVLNDEFSREAYGANSLSYLNNSIDVDDIAGKYCDVSDECVLVYMANFRPSKGTMDVLSIYKNIRSRIKCKLLMIGNFTSDDFEKEVLNYIKEEAIADVEFLGFLEGNEKYSALSSGSLFIYPSYDDSFGLVILEAQALGLPVCAYDIGSMQQIVNKERGSIVSVGDVIALEKACIEQLKVGRLRPDIDFLNDYELKTYVDRFIKIIET